MKALRRSSLLVALCILALCCGCTKKENAEETEAAKTKYTATFFDYFDTVTSLTGYDSSEEHFNEISAFIESELKRYDGLYDNYEALSDEANLYKINLEAGTAPVTVSEEIIDLFKFGKEIYTLTNGRTNFAMGAVLSIWHEYRETALNDPTLAAVPDLADLQAAAGHCNIDDVIIDDENNTIFYSDPLLKCDVGAFAKGYAIQKITDELIEKGVTCYCLNVGGNVVTIGTKPDGSNWNVAIQNPDLSAEKSYIEAIKFSNKSLATSGSYQRYYEVDGVRYHHIINPDTLFPDNTYLSVSVTGTDAGTGDALSTALFNMSLEEGMNLINSLDGFEAMWYLSDGSMYYTDGFKTE